MQIRTVLWSSFSLVSHTFAFSDFSRSQGARWRGGVGGVKPPC